MSTLAGFRKELEALINKHSMENGSDTPDFILAEFLTDCLAAFDKTTRRRVRWYEHSKEPVTPATVEELDAILNAPEPPVTITRDGMVKGALPRLRQDAVQARLSALETQVSDLPELRGQIKAHEQWLQRLQRPSSGMASSDSDFDAE